MDYYVDIILRLNAKMPVNRLLNSVYTKFHKALFDLSSTSIGVSFPRYKVTLGNVMRLHGSEAELLAVQQKNWLGTMTGYCKISDISPVPDDVRYRNIRRKQTTMSQSKLTRLIKRGSITEEDAKQYKAKMYTKGLDSPYLELQSGSNGHKHRRYIEFGQLHCEQMEGEFDQFGLSKTASVPWF